MCSLWKQPRKTIFSAIENKTYLPPLWNRRQVKEAAKEAVLLPALEKKTPTGANKLMSGFLKIIYLVHISVLGQQQ